MILVIVQDGSMDSLAPMRGKRSGVIDRAIRRGECEMAAWRARRRDRHPRGFTLVEILIVVLIIGILLAIAVPQFQNARAGAHARACQHNLKQIVGAKERWAMDNDQDSLATPTLKPDLTPAYLKDPEAHCPAGGTYTVGRMDETPGCSIGGPAGQYDSHTLP
jgi:prepilin-type N-terminal cleavage/methylation domain-containing protein